jgi:hypothetical protein
MYDLVWKKGVIFSCVPSDDGDIVQESVQLFAARLHVRGLVLRLQMMHLLNDTI